MRCATHSASRRITSKDSKDCWKVAPHSKIWSQDGGQCSLTDHMKTKKSRLSAPRMKNCKLKKTSQLCGFRLTWNPRNPLIIQMCKAKCIARPKKRQSFSKTRRREFPQKRTRRRAVCSKKNRQRQMRLVETRRRTTLTRKKVPITKRELQKRTGGSRSLLMTCSGWTTSTSMNYLNAPTKTLRTRPFSPVAPKCWAFSIAQLRQSTSAWPKSGQK